MLWGFYMNSDKLEVFQPTSAKVSWLEKRLLLAEHIQETQRELILGQKQVLDAIQRVSELYHTDLDRDDVLDILCKEIVELGQFRSLMMALVDPSGQTICVVRNFVYTNLSEQTQKTPSSVLVKRPLPFPVTYALEDENITAFTVRAKTVQVVDDKNDERLDEKIEKDIEWDDKVAYFIPIQQGGNDVVGVVATGSLRTEQVEVVKRIEWIQPALNVIGTLIRGIFGESVQKTSYEPIQEPTPESIACLSGRECEILKAIALERSNKEIADQLTLSVRTVETYRRNLMKKLEIHTVVGLVKYAIRHGLVTMV